MGDGVPGRHVEVEVVEVDKRRILGGLWRDLFESVTTSPWNADI